MIKSYLFLLITIVIGCVGYDSKSKLLNQDNAIFSKKKDTVVRKTCDANNIEEFFDSTIRELRDTLEETTIEYVPLPSELKHIFYLSFEDDSGKIKKMPFILNRRSEALGNQHLANITSHMRKEKIVNILEDNKQLFCLPVKFGFTKRVVIQSFNEYTHTTIFYSNSTFNQ